MKNILALCFIGLSTLVSGQHYELYLSDISPTGATITMSMTRKITGFQTKLLCIDCNTEFANGGGAKADNTIVPASWMVDCRGDSCVGFSLSNLAFSGEGPLVTYFFDEVQGSLQIEATLVDDNRDPITDLSVSQAQSIPRPSLDFDFTEVKPDEIVISTEVTGWPPAGSTFSAVYKGRFNVYCTDANGAIMHNCISSWSVSSDYPSGSVFYSDFACSLLGDSKFHCQFENLPAEKRDLVVFGVAPGSHKFHIEEGDLKYMVEGGDLVDGPSDDGRALKAFHTYWPDNILFDVDMDGGVVGIPKVGLGFASIDAVQIDDDNLRCPSGELCVQKEMKATIGYTNLDPTEAIYGFQIDVDADITWGRFDVPQVMKDGGFTVSHNGRGTFVAWSMQGSSVPYSSTVAPLLHFYFTRELDAKSFTLKNEVFSNAAGVSLATIIYREGASPDYLEAYKTGLGGAVNVPGCDGIIDGTKDGFCDDEDSDCDCCLNNVDKFPADSNQGCGICGDVNNNGELDIMDILLTINMVEGVMNDDITNADANGDLDITVRDIVEVIEGVQSPDATRKTRPCTKIEEYSADP